MLKQNAIAGTVVIASVLALGQSANAQYYYRPGPGYYPGPAPRYLPYPGPAPRYLPPRYPQQQPYSYYPQPQPAPRQAQWNTTSNGWPQFPTASQDWQAIQQAAPVFETLCGIFC
jgi:hypothetical protein